MPAPSKLVDVPPVPPALTAEHDISFYLHESLLQGIIEGLDLGGHKTTSGTLMRLLRLSGLTFDEPETEGTADDYVDIELAQVDPLVIRIGDDETRVTVRATFKPAGQDHAPSFEVTIPLGLEKNEANWVLKPRRSGGASSEPPLRQEIDFGTGHEKEDRGAFAERKLSATNPGGALARRKNSGQDHVDPLSAGLAGDWRRLNPARWILRPTDESAYLSKSLTICAVVSRAKWLRRSMWPMQATAPKLSRCFPGIGEAW